MSGEIKEIQKALKKVQTHGWSTFPKQDVVYEWLRTLLKEYERLHESIQEAMEKEWDLAGEPTPVYTILHYALHRSEQR